MSSGHSEPILGDAKFEPQEDLDRLQKRAWMVGVIALVATAAGYFMGSEIAFYRAYLIGWLWALGIALGLFAASMLAHISGGDWGVVMRRLLEAGGRTLPFFLIAGIPLVIGLEDLFHWSHYAHEKAKALAENRPFKHDHLLDHKSPYLNDSAFLIRAVVYFVLWSGLAYLLSAASRRYDATGDHSHLVRMKKLSALGLIIYVLTSTLASVDWVMSLDPHWFSSLFGFAFVAGHALSAFSFIVLMMVFLQGRKPMSEILNTKIFHDYGKLMLATVMVWAYFMISQFLIIWSGNLPEEVGWYIARSTNGWQAISLLLILGHFAMPFVVLLSADLKKQGRKLMIVACWLLAMRVLDFFWQTVPHMGEGVSFHWLYITAPIGIGGIWLGLLLGQLKNRDLVPIRDPRLKEVLSHG